MRLEKEAKISLKCDEKLTAIISVPGSTLVIAGGILYTAGVDEVKFEVFKDNKGRYLRMLNMKMDTENIEPITDPQKISKEIEKLFVEN